MYARYIPPPKPKPSSESSLVTNTAPSTQQPESVAAQPKRIVFSDDAFPVPDTRKWRRDDESAGDVGKGASISMTDATQIPNLALAGPKGVTPKKGKLAERLEGNAVSRKPEEAAVAEVQPADDDRPRPKRQKKKNKRLEKETAEDNNDVRIRHKSVFEKVDRALQLRPATLPEDARMVKSSPEPEVHGLEPLPQPEPARFDEAKLTYETLPAWLASPIRVTGESRCLFSDLGIPAASARVLALKGFDDAFAVQTAVLPLLIPTADGRGDVVVAAPTGSGKTLSYVLPMVQDISKGRVTRLRAIIVLPTRELVQQVQSACEACVAAFAIGNGKRVKVGTAVGNKSFKDEQASIMGQEQRYDPAGYEKYLKQRRTLACLNDSSLFGLDAVTAEPLPYHTVAHTSKIDILICTPGRLVEHINKTPGFSLDYVRWLVVDEADKLLSQDFQQWLDLVLKGLGTTKPSYRDFPGSNKTGPRKVILSATMTRDIGLLNGLRLSRPRLVLLEGTKAGEQTLPALLKEAAIKVREPSQKPLYLLELLNSEHLVPVDQSKEQNTPVSTDSESDDSSETNTDSSDSSSDSESDRERSGKREKPFAASVQARKFRTTVLIFTKSNEATLRLSRLLEILSPDLAPLIGTLTSTTKTSKRAHTLRSFAQGKLRILVASDLVSRGVDLQNLDHVINYDLPMSETSYVHRVGRTARAGRAGYAWTLLEYAEGRRFWREFVGEGKGASTSIVRSGRVVERVTLDDGGDKGFDKEMIMAYEAALEQLRKEAVDRK